MQSAPADDLRSIRAISLLISCEELMHVGLVQAWLLQACPSPPEERRGRRSFDRMVTSHVCPVVCRWLRQQRHRAVAGIDLLDLLQACDLLLMQVLRRCDARRGDRFSTDASRWIRQAFHRHRHDLSSPIRLPETISALAGRAQASQGRAALPFIPASPARQLGTSPGGLQQVLELQRPLRLNRPCASTGGETSLLESVEDIRRNRPGESCEWHHDRLQQLGSRERTVVTLRHLVEQPETLDRISERTGLSRSRMVHREQRAQQRLRRAVSTQAP